MTEEEQIVKPEENTEASRFGIKLRFGIRNFLAAGGIFAVCLFLFIFDPVLIFDEVPSGILPLHMKAVAAYSAALLPSWALCFLEIKLPAAVKRAFGIASLFILPALAFLAVDILNSTAIGKFSFLTGLGNYIIYLMVFAFIYALSGRAWITALAGGAVSLIFAAANYYVSLFRGVPVLPWDLQSLGTAADVMGNYSYDIPRLMALFVFIYLLCVMLCLRFCPVSGSLFPLKIRIAERLTALGVSVVLGVLVFSADILTSMGISVWAWDQLTSSKRTGMAAGFCANIQYIIIDVPEGYSEEQLEEIKAEIEILEDPAPLGSPDGLPTVLVVMNECFTDMQSTSEGAVSFTPDNLSFFHSLQESGSVIWGNAYASVFGGNTCNSEYEFLTGNTTAFFPSGSKPFQQYVDTEQTALPSALESFGYKDVAIHPGQPGAWDRDTVYPFFGFDEFKHVRNFDVKRTFEHDLTSDISNYRQVFYEYEQRDKDDPLFIFNVTIQNHGGYSTEGYPTTVRVDGASGEYPLAEQYLSLTKKSDEAFEELIGYFSEQEEPVIILFFGDHWPNLEADFFSMLFGRSPDDTGDIETVMKKHEVPFMIWANYPLEAQYVEKISLNYLSSLLLRAADIPLTDYQKYLTYVQESVPVITANGIYGSDGKWYEAGSETPYDELLNKYASLQYNNIFDDDGKLTELFVP